MVRVGRIAAYFALGSLAAGTVFGLGFAINFRGDISARDEERRRRLGPSERFDLGEIYGALTHHAQPSPTMVFVHGRSANWSEALPMAERFYAEGYNIVLWGRSGRAIHYADDGTRDVLRVVDHVRKHPAVDRNKIFVFGLSLGAALALGAAAGDDSSHIAGVIADSPYGNLRAAAFHYVTAFGHIPKLFAWPTAFVMFRVAEAVHSIEFTRCNPVDWARRIRCPVLLIHGKRDWRVPPEHSIRLFETITSRKDLWLVEGAGHTQAFFRKPHEYIHRVKQCTAQGAG